VTLTGRIARARLALPRGRGGWQHDDVDYLLAQVNIGRMREPLDSPLLADFTAALEPVNAAADAFTLKEHFPPPDVAGFGPIRSPEGWTCPA
jgi:hypothetical protein